MIIPEKIKVQRRKYDLQWCEDVDPLEVSVNVEECIDILHRVAKYLKEYQHDWVDDEAPRLKFIDQSPTLATVCVTDDPASAFGDFGTITVERVKNGSRLTFELRPGREGADRKLRAVYGIIANNVYELLLEIPPYFTKRGISKANDAANAERKKNNAQLAAEKRRANLRDYLLLVREGKSEWLSLRRLASKFGTVQSTIKGDLRMLKLTTRGNPRAK